MKVATNRHITSFLNCGQQCHLLRGYLALLASMARMANNNQGEERVQGNDVAIKRWSPSDRVQGLHREMEAGHR